MKPLSIFAILMLLIAATLPMTSTFAGSQAAEAVAPVSVFFVRHAETAASTRTNHDPDLSAAGKERAQDLAELLKNAGVTHLFASEFKRTQATLADLAKGMELQVEVVAARDMATQIAKLRSLPAGSVAVVCGHSNTVPAMVIASGGVIADLKDSPPAAQVLAHESYDRLFLLILPATEGVASKSLELRYGPSSAAALTEHAEAQ